MSSRRAFQPQPARPCRPGARRRRRPPHPSAAARPIRAPPPAPSVRRSPAKQQMGAPLRIGDGCAFQSFRTSAYKLHFLESPSGLKVGAAALAPAMAS